LTECCAGSGWNVEVDGELSEVDWERWMQFNTHERQIDEGE